ncbi:putative BYS1 domain protein [Lepidopterella palustris CBS 459.81]|uniref:Putative BYS1 domain protein n=1 Tax=Lepidopterella palustris CBS 459.81 TaxID=1314670 RepID=A0A8E2E5F5_9PEZI|nr:putative BYS1 domain protein [Lepidopterella palustris CBS 459.81]
MRLPIPFLPLLSTLPSLTHALGSAFVLNNCAYPIYLWSVSSTISPSTTVLPDSYYQEPLHFDPATGGIAIKITTTPNGLYDHSPQLNFAYVIDAQANVVYYDINDVFGDTFKGEGVEVSGLDADCPVIEWKDGVQPGGVVTKACSADSDIFCSLC